MISFYKWLGRYNFVLSERDLEYLQINEVNKEVGAMTKVATPSNGMVWIGTYIMFNGNAEVKKSCHIDMDSDLSVCHDFVWVSSPPLFDFICMLNGDISW